MKDFDRKSLGNGELNFYLQRLKVSYFSTLILIGVLALASFTVLIVQIQSQGRYGTRGALSNRQRVLAQRIALFSLRLTQEPDPAQREDFRETIAKAADELERIENGMLAGDAGLGLHGTPSPEIAVLYVKAPVELDRKIRDLIRRARLILAQSDAGPLGARSPEIEHLMRVVPTVLPPALDQMIAAYRSANERQTRILQLLETAFVVLLLVTLIGEMLFIFRPLLRTINREAAAVAENRQRLEAVLTTVGEAIITTDADLVIQSANAETERVWNFPSGELIGQRLSTLVLPGRDLSPNDWQELFPSDCRIETVGVRRSGQTFPLEILLTETPLVDDPAGRKLHTVSARDITERVETAHEIAVARDAALASNRAKSDFVANMSHEIRTPMNGILGMADLLHNTGLNAEQRDLVDTIRQSGDALLTIVNDILDFSKIEAGKLSLESLPFDLREVVESTADLLAGRALQKQLELITRVDADVPTLLCGDPGRLRQILLNLLGNALKFTATGEVFLRVSCKPKSDSHANLRFSVRDSGIGIDPASRQRLFKAFSQAEDSTARRFGGTGLGLTISRQLVELMGGQIDVDSEPGKGSTFWFTATLERQTTTPAAVLSEAANHARKAATLRGKQALIVDDNATLRETLADCLTAWGMHADTAEAGGPALTRLREMAATGSPYDLALLDLNLRSMDGFTLAWGIHNQSSLSNLRVILMTTLGLDIDQKAIRHVGIRASVSKPLKYQALLNALTRALAADSSRDEVTVCSDATGHAPSPAPTVSTGRILFAEDNAINRKLTTRQLANLGYEVETVTDGREALAALEETRYDLVLLDMLMPDMNGFEAASAIRLKERERQGRRLPLIAMTASNLSGDRELCLAAGMDDFLSKPVRQHELGEMLARWLPVAAEAKK